MAAREWPAAYAAMHQAGEAAFPPACLNYVLTCVRNAANGRKTPLSPSDTVATFRQRASADFGPLLQEVLEDWGLRTPEELGKAVLLLGKHECLTLEASDTVEAFARDTVPFTVESA